jgi:uncharacterized protein (UPF0332 family)
MSGSNTGLVGDEVGCLDPLILLLRCSLLYFGREVSMSVPNQDARQEIRLYIDHAHEMLEVAALTLAEGYQGSTINRAYYAIFYATNALLATQGFSRSKHSGAISAFREHFVRPGLIEAEYSRIYGRIMDNRRVSDYEIELAVDVRAAEMDLSDAQRFVERVKEYLRQEDWL